MKKAATRARSHVRGLWPVIHIIEQSLRQSSSASPVAVSLFKIDKKSCVLSSFVPFLLLSFSSSSSVPLFVCSFPSLRSVLGHRLPLVLHHDALCINGNQIFKCVLLMSTFFYFFLLWTLNKKTPLTCQDESCIWEKKNPLLCLCGIISVAMKEVF